MDTISFVLSFTPIESLIQDLKHFIKDLNLSEMDPSHGISSKDFMKLLGKTILESSQKSEID